MTIRDAIGALPSDAIAQLWDKYFAAFDAALENDKRNYDHAREVAAQVFRDALAAVLPPEAPAPDWLKQIATEMPFLADYLLTENGRVGWELTVRQWAERLQEYIAGAAASRPEGDGAGET